MLVEVIFSDNDIIVLNKPAGISVHGGPNVKGETIVDFLIKHFPEVKGVGDDPARPGIVHRLDRDASGVLVVARNTHAFEGLKLLFKTRNIEKIYLTVVCGKPKNREGIISYPIGRDAKNPTRRGAGGGRARAGAGRQLLHAQSLSFSFPEGRRIKFEADPPEDFMRAQSMIFG